MWRRSEVGGGGGGRRSEAEVGGGGRRRRSEVGGGGRRRRSEVDVRVRKLWCNSACGGGRRRRLEAEADAEADVDVRVRINNIKISCGVVVEVVGKHRASPLGCQSQCLSVYRLPFSSV